MTRKRSRDRTEQRFQDAVLELVADSGCEELGVNLVAERAGADKVLIYRYFGNLEGLLERVAESRQWLPSAEEVANNPGRTPKDILGNISDQVYKHIRYEPATFQTALWQHAIKNPLTERYAEEWKTFWKELTEIYSKNAAYEDRKQWTRAIEMLAMITRSRICGESMDPSWLELLSEGLQLVSTDQEDAYVEDDVLPTNLL